MLVSSAPFFIFLVAVCLLCWLSAGSRRIQLVVLAAANLFFLARFNLIYLALPLATTVDYLIGWGIRMSPRKGGKRLLLAISLLVNLGLLATIKLIPFSTGARWQWMLTLSISFYCFQSLSYTIDIYRDEIHPTQNYVAYLASALFFPSITAGPIPRTGRLLAQFSRPFNLTPEMGGRALLLIGTGLVKKLLIADYLSNNLVARIFDTPALYSSSEILVGIYGYALQLFFDFSGYTDMVLGAALLLGIELPENFRQPYLSINIAEFWRRWHISFSQWLRDYLFDSLPKRRKFPVFSYCYAFFITMVLGGLWHGISWNFLIWGALHGAALGTVYIWQRWRKASSATRTAATTWWGKTLAGLLTFHFVCFAWIFFRATSLENVRDILRGIGALTLSLANITPLVAAVLLIAVVFHCLPTKWFDRCAILAGKMPFWVQGLALAGLILFIQTLAGRGSAPFVYGNF